MQSNFITKFLTIIFVLFLSQSAFAQATGKLSCTVKDQNDAVVQGASA